ncbi:MAG: hypothetical protein K8T90_20065 [Planctomycetes bacterium]|nr:hypothetical protein [Planctomycetota bacterium]
MYAWIILLGPFTAPIVVWLVAEHDGEVNPWVWGVATGVVTAASYALFSAGLLRLGLPFALGLGGMTVWKMTRPSKPGSVRR